MQVTDHPQGHQRFDDGEVHKIQHALTFSDMEEAFMSPPNDWAFPYLERLADAIKAKGPLPPREEAAIYTILKPLGSAGSGPADNCVATLAGKVLWRDGEKATKSTNLWDTRLEELLYA